MLNLFKKRIKDDTFEIAGKVFEKRYFPNIYDMYKISPQNAEDQLRSIAKAWHNGNIISAAQAFESDLSHLQ